MLPVAEGRQLSNTCPSATVTLSLTYLTLFLVWKHERHTPTNSAGVRRYIAAFSKQRHACVIHAPHEYTPTPPLNPTLPPFAARVVRPTLLLLLLLCYWAHARRYVQVNAGMPYWEAIILVSISARIAVLPAVTTFVRMRSKMRTRKRIRSTQRDVCLGRLFSWVQVCIQTPK